MNRKLVGILVAVLVAVAGSAVAVSMTWTESKVTMTAGTASVVSIGLFEDCATTVPFTTHDWDGVVQDQEYEVTTYVKNTGNQAVYITYTPSTKNFDGDQTRFRIVVNVIESPATPCQLLPMTPQALPVKDPMNCPNGFLLLPGKVIKVDIILLVDSTVSGGTWSWDFFIAGCAP